MLPAPSRKPKIKNLPPKMVTFYHVHIKNLKKIKTPTHLYNFFSFNCIATT
ncbi:MAG: hypothetical protein ACI8RD_004958, partial [Bacillariaceae sp.]